MASSLGRLCAGAVGSGSGRGSGVAAAVGTAVGFGVAAAGFGAGGRCAAGRPGGRSGRISLTDTAGSCAGRAAAALPNRKAAATMEPCRAAANTTHGSIRGLERSRSTRILETGSTQRPSGWVTMPTCSTPTWSSTASTLTTNPYGRLSSALR